MTNNTNIIRAMERMNSIIEEMKKLHEEFKAIFVDNEIEEKEENNEEAKVENDYSDDLDSFENLSEEELEGLLTDEYKEAMSEEMNEELTDEEMTELIENDYYDWENDLDDDEEEIITYKINFNEEEFALLYEITNDIPYGYLHNTLTNEYIVTVDEYTIYDIKEKLDIARSYELYENCNRFAAERITDLLNIIYLEQKYTMLYGTDDEE